MEARLARVPADNRSSSSMYYWAFLSCRSGPVAKSFYLILLQRLADGEQIFTRARPDILARLGKRDASRRISVHLINDDNNSGSDQCDPEEKKRLRCLLERPVKDPKVQIIYVARSPPLSKSHFPIRIGMPENRDASDGPGDLHRCFKLDAIARYDRDLAVKLFRSWSSSE